MRHEIAQTLLYGGAFMALGSVFTELAQAQTWAEVMTPAHIFGSLGALVTAVGALYRRPPGAQS